MLKKMHKKMCGFYNMICWLHLLSSHPSGQWVIISIKYQYLHVSHRQLFEIQRTGGGCGGGGGGSLNWKPKACALFTIRIFWSNGGVVAGSHIRECEGIVKLTTLLMTAESMMQDKHQSIMHEFKSNYRRKLIKSGCPFGFRGLAVEEFLVKLIISFWDECQPARF